jgi:hypothetical protein
MGMTETALKFVQDPRVTLCDLFETAGALGAVAEGALEPTLAAYASARGVRLEVTFPQPHTRQVVVGRTPLFRNPSLTSETVSEVGFGEVVTTYDARGGFVRVAAQHDGYLGWVPASALGSLPEATHRFTNLRGHVFAGPEVAAARRLELAYGAALRVLDEKGGWSKIALEDGEGYVWTGALEPLARSYAPTPEAVTRLALRFLETPYLWGGVSAWGLDCSGLVGTVFRAFGVALPRDADQQSECGLEVSPAEVRAADLLFFPGHVAIALDAECFVHANAHHMCVSVDSFSGDAYGRGLREALTKAVRLV